MFFGGGSITTLTNGGNAPSPVVYGDVEIENGETFPLQSNQINFVGTVVYGSVERCERSAPPRRHHANERAAAAPWGRSW